MSKKNIAKVRKWWRQGKNIWEISQITGLPEAEVMAITRTL